MLLSAQNLMKNYVDKPLLSDVSLYIKEGDRIGLVGVNGTGKSTLLKILAGKESADSGNIVLSSKAKIGYLPQAPDFTAGNTILEQVLASLDRDTREEKQYEAKRILTKLGITDFDTDVALLSGGQKKRVAIASVLVHPSNLLILDEPTNHIDSSMVAWLEEYLSKYTGALFLVTHDRYFLDRVVNTVAELDRGSLFLYEGANYSKYLEGKALREEMQAASERKRQSLMKKELAWLSRGARARGTKSRFRIERYEQLKEETIQEPLRKLSLSSASTRLGRKTVELHALGKAYGEKTLFENLSYQIRRDDRLGILGPNGCGKSTLLRMILGTIPPDSGEVITGDTVKFGYFSQENQEMDPNQRVIDFIRDVGEFLQTAEGKLSASQMLEKFLFDGAMQWSPIGKLSGGEKRRLALLRVLMEAPNILLLDEPTNDLDIETLTILEDYLEHFDGAVIAVSHDRYFLDKMAEHVLVFEGNGTVSEHLGGYTEYFLQSVKEKEGQAPGQDRERGKKSSQFPKRLRFSYQEQREYDSIDGEIAELEQEISTLEQRAQACAGDYIQLEEILAEKSKKETALEEKMDRWVYLSELAQKIEEQGK